jgi:regulator of replication initiation timing
MTDSTLQSQVGFETSLKEGVQGIVDKDLTKIKALKADEVTLRQKIQQLSLEKANLEQKKTILLEENAANDQELTKLKGMASKDIKKIGAAKKKAGVYYQGMQISKKREMGDN